MADTTHAGSAGSILGPPVAAPAAPRIPGARAAAVTVLRPHAPEAVARDASGRLEALDGARALFVMLGLVLHSAAPYLTHADWAVHDGERSALLTAVHAFVHAFRMPGFFLIAGLLTTLAWSRLGTARLLHSRILRLGLPFVGTLMTLNVLEWHLLARTSAQCLEASPCGVGAPSGLSVGHLWFLPMLLACTLLAAAVPRQLRAAASTVVRRLDATDWTRLGALGIALALAVACFLWKLAAVALAKLPGAAHEWFGFLSVAALFEYSFYYGVGALLATSTLGRAWLRRRVSASDVLAMTTTGAAALALAWHAGPQGTIAGKFLVFAMHAVATVTLLQAAIHASVHLYDRRAAVVRFACDHAYRVYLVHHVIVVALAIATLGMPLPPLAKFALVLTVATGLSFALSAGFAAAKRHLRALRASARAPSAT